MDPTDLIGDVGDGDNDGDGAADGDNDAGGALGAVNDGVRASSQDQSAAQKETERKLVKKLWAEYETARLFDKPTRAGYDKDRKYAAGLADPAWASDANLIGSFIDILKSFLYAQNPDVSCRAAAQAGEQPNADNTAFAETLEIVISKLWTLAGLKKTARRAVRSTLTVGVGWFKALMWSKKRPQPTVEKELQNAQAQMARIQALAVESQEDSDDKDVQTAQMSQLIAGLRAKMMLQKLYGMNIDFVRAEDMQVSLDVSSIIDHVDADWNSEDMYIPRTALRTRFPRLTEEDAERAVSYYQKPGPANTAGDVLQSASGDTMAEGAFSKTQPSGEASSTGTKSVEFVRIVELWDRRDGNIKTVCDGLDRWCVEPYTPPQGSTRFYPYFMLAFFDVDGYRHPQSLVGRLRKLQDEYSACRSNQRLTRERSIPGLIFNAGLLSADDAKKLSDSVIAEMVGIKPTDITTPIQNIVMVKPLPTIDIRLWDTASVRQDMESLSGVQEALQQTMMQQPKTATEAQIQQTGFASRTTADRDMIEDLLENLAIYTAETGLQEIDGPGAQRIAGPKAFWPVGMDIQDLLTLVSVDIKAGTTGKPNLALDKANWATILPLLQKLMIQIRQVEQSDPPLATALEALLRESLKRMDDRLEVDQFFPSQPAPPQPPAPPPQPTVSIALKGDLPPLDASMIGARAAGLPPAAALADGGANATAMQHASGMNEGELPPHPLMPQPLPEPKKTPMQGGATQMK